MVVLWLSRPPHSRNSGSSLVRHSARNGMLLSSASQRYSEPQDVRTTRSEPLQLTTFFSVAILTPRAMPLTRASMPPAFGYQNAELYSVGAALVGSIPARTTAS